MEFNNVNIGEAIQQRLKTLKMSKAEFGRKAGLSKQNVNRFLERTSMDTDKLVQICQVLDYNFFQLYTPVSQESYSSSGPGALTVKNIGRIGKIENNFAKDDITAVERVTEIDEFSENLILPPDCPAQAKQAVNLLKLEISMLNRIIEEKDERILLYQQLLNR